MDYKQLALDTARRSSCKKRKVGAVIVNPKTDEVISVGYNYHPTGAPCEDINGVTDPNVVHAEIEAIDAAEIVDNTTTNGMTMYVTHQPCIDCQRELDQRDIDVIVVEDFMKFDTDKLRYDLVPPSAFKALAEVLTYGARKYKPNNWQNCPDPSRYTAALYRHLEAWRSGEQCDSESGLHHLKHAITNIAFLLHFEETNNG